MSFVFLNFWTKLSRAITKIVQVNFTGTLFGSELERSVFCCRWVRLACVFAKKKEKKRNTTLYKVSSFYDQCVLLITPAACQPKRIILLVSSSKQLSLANDFIQRTLMFQDIFYLRHEWVTKKMTIMVPPTLWVIQLLQSYSEKDRSCEVGSDPFHYLILSENGVYAETLERPLLSSFSSPVHVLRQDPLRLFQSSVVGEP